jgi:hypothetical protein
MFRKVLFWIKKLVDNHLYGQVLVPPMYCPACGCPCLAGESVTPPYHAKCTPKPKKAKE